MAFSAMDLRLFMWALPELAGSVTLPLPGGMEVAVAVFWRTTSDSCWCEAVIKHKTSEKKSLFVCLFVREGLSWSGNVVFPWVAFLLCFVV